MVSRVREDGQATEDIYDVLPVFGLADSKKEAPRTEFHNIVHASWGKGGEGGFYRRVGYWPFRLLHMILNFDILPPFHIWVQEQTLNKSGMDTVTTEYYGGPLQYLHNAGNDVFHEASLLWASLLIFAVIHGKCTLTHCGLPAFNPWGDAILLVIDFEGFTGNTGAPLSEIGPYFVKISDLAKYPISDWNNHFSVIHFRILETEHVQKKDMLVSRLRDMWHPNDFRRGRHFGLCGRGPRESQWLRACDIPKILQAANEIPLSESDPLTYVQKVYAHLNSHAPPPTQPFTIPAQRPETMNPPLHVKKPKKGTFPKAENWQREWREEDVERRDASRCW